MISKNSQWSAWTSEEENYEERQHISHNHGTMNVSEDKYRTSRRGRLLGVFMSPICLGLIIGILAGCIGLAAITSLWLTATTTVTTVTTTTVSTTTTSITTSTTASTSTSTTTSTSTSTSTTTTAPPSILCSTTSSSGVLYNNQFIYSPTQQIYAAGMLNNQFGVYKAYGYNNVTSTALWMANQTGILPNSHVSAQTDRHIVVYAGNGTVLWASYTEIPVHEIFCLQMLDSGVLIYTNSTNAIIWSTNSTIGTG